MTDDPLMERLEEGVSAADLTAALLAVLDLCDEDVGVTEALYRDEIRNTIADALGVGVTDE